MSDSKNRWDCLDIKEYSAPDGYYDTPFVYTYDASALNDSQSYYSLSVPVDGDSLFLLRRAAGQRTVADLYRLYGHDGAPLCSEFWNMTIPALWDIPIVPQRAYPPSGFIRFDLGSVSKASKTPGGSGSAQVFLSTLVFQGVKRFRGKNPLSAVGMLPSQGKYHLRPYTYRTTITVDWNVYRYDSGGTVLGFSAPRQFSIPVNDYAFEVGRMSLLTTSGASWPGGSGVDAAQIKMMLYDWQGHQVFKDPIEDRYVFANTDLSDRLVSVLSPSLVYPPGSMILFDVYSLLFAADLPAHYEIAVQGMQRIPE